MEMMFAVLMCVVVLVSGECPSKCHCSSYKTLCTFARLNTVPTGLANTTQLLRIHLDHIAQLNKSIISHLQNLTHLELVNVQLQQIESGTFYEFQKLQSLVITHNNISVLQAHTFEFLRSLYFLNLSMNGITATESSSFSGLANLYFLDMSHNNVNILPFGLFSVFQNLRHLDISQNRIKSFHAGTFDGMRSVSNCGIIKTPTKLNLFQKFETDIAPGTFDNLCFTYLNLGPANLNQSSSNLNRVTKLKISIQSETFTFDILNGLKDLSYLDISHGNIRRLQSSFHENLNLVKYLDLSFNLISKIQPGAFKGFLSIKILILRGNNVSPLYVNTFLNLKSLQSLDVSRCRITMIKPGAFNGLAELRFLDLSHNVISILKNNTFLGLRNLQKLNLYHNYITYIETEAFLGLRALKDLTSYLNYFSLYSTNPTIEIGNTTLQMFQRIDSLALSQPLKSLENLQVLKTLHLYIDAKFYNPQQVFQETMQTIANVTIFKVTLLQINQIKTITLLTGLPISTMYLFKSNFKVLDNNSFTGLSTVKSLTIDNCEVTTLGRESFYQMKSLTELVLIHNSQLTIKPHSFLGLINLKKLNLDHNKISALSNDTFSGLENLKQLLLCYNNLNFLDAGTFHHLRNIQEIDLHHNKLSSIPLGVFGAICDEKFQPSCEAPISLQHCDTTNALTTLKHLDLSWNNITYIHSHAFISCTNLQMLVLKKNRLLTLQDSFLFIPRLVNLDISWCNIRKIPSNFFECTPLLATIDLAYNRICELSIIPLLPLKKLQHFNISRNPMLCNCEFSKSWIWFHENHVDFRSNDCGHRNILNDLSNLNCNNKSSFLIPPDSIKQFNASTSAEKYFLNKLYLQPLVLINIFILGIACNAFILFISLYHSDVRTKENIIVIHLATINLLSLTLNLPLNYWEVLGLRWESTDIFCKILIISKDFTVSVMTFSTMALSLERYLVVRSFYTKNSTYVSQNLILMWLLVTAWVFAILISLPSFLFATADTRCLYCPAGYEFYIKCIWVLQFTISCLMPAVVTFYFNANTSRILKENLQHIYINNRKTVVNFLSTLAFLFVISYQPNIVVRMIFNLFETNIENLFAISVLSFCLFFCNTVFIPISIMLMITKYKIHTLSYFPRNLRSRSATRYQLDSEAPERMLATNYNSSDRTTGRDRMKPLIRLRKYLRDRFNRSGDEPPDSGIELQDMTRQRLTQNN